MSKLGLIAGGGDLPRAVAESARADGRALFIAAVTGSLTEPWVRDFPHEFISIGAPGQAFKSFRREGVTEVLLAGKVDRPDFSSLKVDMKGKLANRFDCLRAPFQLSVIALFELRPLRRVMAEPLPQPCTGCELPRPEIDAKLAFGTAAWPEPVHQHTISVGTGWRIVGTLEFY